MSRESLRCKGPKGILDGALVDMDMGSVKGAAESRGWLHYWNHNRHFSSGAPRWKEWKHWCHLNPALPRPCLCNYVACYILWWIHPEFILTVGVLKHCMITLILTNLSSIYISQMKNQKKELTTSRQLTSKCFQSQDYNARMLDFYPHLSHYTAPFPLFLPFLSRDQNTIS